MLKYKQNLYFVPLKFIFCQGQNIVFLDKYFFKMTFPIHWDTCQEPKLFLQDLLHIFSPSLCFESSILVGAIGNYPVNDLKSPLSLINVIESTLGLKYKYEGDYLIFSKNSDFADYASLETCRSIIAGKDCGELDSLFWFDEVNALIPYKIYVPSYFQNTMKSLPLLVVLHGGGSTPDELFTLSNHRISFLAEERGFFILSASGCIKNSTYGCCIPPQGLAKDSTVFTLSEQYLWEHKVSEKSLETIISHVCSKYPIDCNRLFLAGNSMGGMGTFYFASTHPNMFRAIAPAGAAPNKDLFDSSPLLGLPILFIAGTEDYHGYVHLKDAYESFKSKGLNINLRTVGGGDHGMAWVQVLDEWIDFLI